MPARSFVAVLLCGALFGFGLALSSMVKPEVILDFLRFRDFGLLLVLGSAVVVTALVYALAPRLMKKPALSGSFGRHASTLDGRTIGGAALFGVGWGLAGVCPGPALAALGVGNWPVLIALAGLFAGAYAHGWVESRGRAPYSTTTGSPTATEPSPSKTR